MNVVYEILKLCLYLVIFIGVLFAAKYTTEFISKKNQGLIKNKRVKLLERISLSKDREILLIEYNQQTYLIGSTNEKFEILEKNSVKVMNEE